jgi:hypothetical protein
MLTEQDARVKAIDRILVDVLGWPLGELSLESPVDKGFIDYRCTVAGASRLVVEAKKDGRDLGISGHHNGKSYLLRGAVFSTEAAKEGIGQGIRYCGQKNAELAAVTNGRQWIVFRGSRLGDGKDSLDGMAFVFDSLEGIKSAFKLFFELLSHHHASRFLYRAHFQEAEGQPIRAHVFRKPLKAEADIRALKRDDISVDVDRVMTSFFQNLSGDKDPEMIVDCFVTSTESDNADRKLARISEDLCTRIRNIETDTAEALALVVERLQKEQRTEFVLLVGTKGAGKSTFVDRFFRHVLKRETRAQCYVCRIDLAKCGYTTDAEIVGWLEDGLLKTLESEIFQDGPPSFDEIQGMFFDEYSRWMKGPYSALYERDKQEFKIKFGEHIERKRETVASKFLCLFVS